MQIAVHNPVTLSSFDQLLGPANDYISNDFGIDRSSRFPRARTELRKTDRQTDRQTDT